MSYVRWGSVIGGKKSWLDIWNEIKDSGENITSIYDQIKNRQLRQEGAYLSDWYIFWHEGDEPLLSCWNKNCKTTPTFSLEEIEIMYKNKNYEDIFGKEVTQINILDQCIYYWLEDIKELL